MNYILEIKQFDRACFVFTEVLDGKTYKETGAIINLSGERVRQIFYRVLRGLRYFVTRLDGTPPEEPYVYDIRGVRANKLFWTTALEAYINAVNKKSKEKQNGISK